jgi:predicted nucleic acid-binding protein
VIALDAGVIALALNRYAPEHPRAGALLESLANGDTPWVLPWPAVHAFVGLVTHPHSVARPVAPADAWGFVRLLLESPVVRAVGPGPRHAAAVAEVLAMLPAEAARPPGLELAAVLHEHGVRELLSTDRGMRAFPFLIVRDPLHGADAWMPHAPPARRYRRLSPRGERNV